MSVTIRANTPYGANIIMISTIFNAMAFPVSSTFLNVTICLAGNNIIAIPTSLPFAVLCSKHL
ncbi:hypothetical protein [Sphingobacterium sp.]|uniref:hypothetical protein n=1 Tax=Sphingobacterium sp. TaxID=341027 RepID=UPI002897DAB7|nr:hypothetical protein [Sphingobacterium sp.]